MEISKLKELHKEKDVIEFSGKCHDCGCSVNLKSEKQSGGLKIEGGALYEAGDGMFFKCDSCFKAQNTLKNHRECEVYSRIVGYLRPISQWNSGKLAEFERRTSLKV
jgi:hypothetical protein